MKFSSIIKSSLIALGINKTRTFLTMLGVIIGVFAVVSLVSLVKGIENFIVDRFNSLGSNLIFVAPGRSGFNSDPALSFTNNKLDEKHIDLISKNLGNDIVTVAPSIRVGKYVKYKTKDYYATIIGSNENVTDLVNVEVEKGSYYTKADVESKSRVVIVGPLIVKELFGNSNPVGESLKIENINFTIIGISKGRGGQQDERVIMPYTTLQDTLDIDNFSNIVTKATNQNDIELVIKKIELALLQDLDEDDFTVLSQASVLESFKSILNVLSIGLAAIAGISLIVGGIGIMNIMLVSVTERIQEIGLRKALGATSKDIGFQFMLESLFISIFGGLLGLGLGYIVTVISKPWLNAEIPWWAIFLAMGFSAAVGLGFGTYPALNAAKKDPIEALRFE